MDSIQKLMIYQYNDYFVFIIKNKYVIIYIYENTKILSIKKYR
jgi:hypothetical protein